MMSQQTQQNPSSNCNIEELNDDILKKIFDYLNFDDKIKLRRTCRKWKNLLDTQLDRIKALRIGQFNQGGYSVTSGLYLQCHQHQTPNHRQQTGTLFNNCLLSMPADLETQCFSIKRYDYLHRSLKQSYTSITMLSLGQLHITYRLLIVLTNNLPNLEHLELIGCASKFEKRSKREHTHLTIHPDQAQKQSQKDSDCRLPSLETFNNSNGLFQAETIYSAVMYNQNQDELVNMDERLIRSTLVKNCELVKEAKRQKHWPNLRHLLVKDCNLLNEFSLCLILAITSQSLVHLAVESSQYLTGEFLNYCGPQLKILRLRYCPLLQMKFLEDLVKIRQFLGSLKEAGEIQLDNTHCRQDARLVF